MHYFWGLNNCWYVEGLKCIINNVGGCINEFVGKMLGKIEITKIKFQNNLNNYFINSWNNSYRLNSNLDTCLIPRPLQINVIDHCCHMVLVRAGHAERPVGGFPATVIHLQGHTRPLNAAPYHARSMLITARHPTSYRRTCLESLSVCYTLCVLHTVILFVCYTLLHSLMCVTFSVGYIFCVLQFRCALIPVCSNSYML